MWLKVLKKLRLLTQLNSSYKGGSVLKALREDKFNFDELIRVDQGLSGMKQMSNNPTDSSLQNPEKDLRKTLKPRNRRY